MQKPQDAKYDGVAVLRPGRFMDSQGRPVEFSAEDLERLARGYDPAYHAAPLTLGHGDEGPSRGRITSLSWDGEYLRADLAGVPPELAAELDAGRYPGRSAEVYADLDGRGPYLRALALLGARPPAVKGLPPLPRRVETRAAIACGSPAARPSEIQTYVSHGVLHTPKHAARIFTLSSEVAMSEFHKNGSPAAETSQLAEENQRLSEENRQLRQEKLRREVVHYLGELRRTGRLTPAMEYAGLEEALVAASEQEIQVTFPDGCQVPLSTVLRAILEALPVALARGEYAPQGAAAPELSADELRIAAQLGLSAEEFASIKAAS